MNKKERIKLVFMGMQFECENPSSKAVLMLTMLLIFFVVVVVLLSG